jgi:hypothetical protein
VDDNATNIYIGFGKGLTEDVYKATGSLWDFRYSGPQSQYSDSIDPIWGPECRIHGNNYACYAAPTGQAGPEGAHKYDHVTLKPGQDTYVYLDVGFWGGATRRTFGLICGPHVWLCNYGQKGGAPEPTDRFANELSQFQEVMGNFGVLNHATAPLDKSDWDMRIYMILPDMHMWPNPEELKKRRSEFFDAMELKELDGGMKDGELIRNTDGSIDVPAEKGESPADHALRMTAAPGGSTAMKENAFRDTRKMSEEEESHAFGSKAGNDLVKLLDALQRARSNPDNPFDVSLLHVGDLLEMWAPYHTWVGSKPFIYEKERLKLSDTVNKRVPKWIEMVYNYGHNKAALQALQNAACRHLYGNHDVYLAFDEWKLTNIKTMDRLRDSRGFFSENLLWVEHGHRFDASNRDGYWMWIDLDHPPGPVVNTAVNYYPALRSFGDQYDNADKNLYQKNVPYATIWYLLAKYANVDKSVGFRLPPIFRIFCQGHTHSPVLLKVNVFWSRLEGKYSERSSGNSDEEEIMFEEQRRDQGARDGSYNPPSVEDAFINLERNREQRVRSGK